MEKCGRKCCSWEMLQVENERLRRHHADLLTLLGLPNPQNILKISRPAFYKTTERVRRLKNDAVRYQSLQKQRKEEGAFVARMKNLLRRLEYKLAQRVHEWTIEREERDKLERALRNEKENSAELLSLYESTRTIARQLRDLVEAQRKTFTWLRRRYGDVLLDRAVIEEKHLRLKNSTGELTCRICLVNRIGACLLPCRHTNFCEACIREMHAHSPNVPIACPLCRQDVVKVVSLLI